jgi:DNA-directed RNA polymerase specialized sigma24 family protein
MSVGRGPVAPRNRQWAASQLGEPRGRFLELDLAYSSKLFDYSQQLTGDPAASAEVVETALAQAAAHFSQADLDDPHATQTLRPRLYSVVRRESLARGPARERETRPTSAAREKDLATRHGAEVTAETLPAEVTAEALTAEYRVADLEAEDSRREAALVSDVLDVLDRPEAELLSLAIRHGLDDDEIAAVLGISRRQAQARRTRAAARFAETAAAVTLLQAGWSGCRKLDRLAGGEYPSTPTSDGMRRRLARHGRSCAICGRVVASHGFGPELLTALPVADLPAAVRRRLGGEPPWSVAAPPAAVPPVAAPPTAAPPSVVPPTAVPPSAVWPSASRSRPAPASPVVPSAARPSSVPAAPVPPSAARPPSVPGAEAPAAAAPPAAVPPRPVAGAVSSDPAADRPDSPSVPRPRQWLTRPRAAGLSAVAVAVVVAGVVLAGQLGSDPARHHDHPASVTSTQAPDTGGSSAASSAPAPHRPRRHRHTKPRPSASASGQAAVTAPPAEPTVTPDAPSPTPTSATPTRKPTPKPSSPPSTPAPTPSPTPTPTTPTPTPAPPAQEPASV